jgi:hypothetical protein
MTVREEFQFDGLDNGAEKLKKVGREAQKTGTKIDKTQRSTKKLGKSQKQAAKTGDGFGKQMAKMAMQAMALSKAINFVQEAYARYLGDMKKGADIIRSTEESFGRLAQISGGSAKKFKELKEYAWDLAKAEGLDPNVAADLTFDLASAEKLDQGKMYAAFARVTDPAELFRNVDKVQTAFGGEKKTGTDRELIAKLLTASGVSTANVGEIAKTVTDPAAAWRDAGWSMEDLFSSIGLVAKATKQPEMAGSRLKEFASQTAKLMDEGKISRAPTPYESAMEIQEKGLKLQGEAKAGMTAVLDLKKDIKTSTKNIRESVPRSESIARDMLTSWNLDPVNRQLRRTKQAKAREDYALYQKGIEDLKWEELEHKASEKSYQAGESWITRSMRSKAISLRRAIGQSPERAERMINAPGVLRPLIGRGVGTDSTELSERAQIERAIMDTDKQKPQVDAKVEIVLDSQDVGEKLAEEVKPVIEDVGAKLEEIRTEVAGRVANSLKGER